MPQNRYFLVRMSAVNSANREFIVPNLSLEDDNGNSYPELGGDAAQGVPQYIGYLRRLKPAESVQGHALFDAPPRHYKLKIRDEDSEKTAYVDTPFVHFRNAGGAPSGRYSKGSAAASPLQEVVFRSIHIRATACGDRIRVCGRWQASCCFFKPITPLKG